MKVSVRGKIALKFITTKIIKLINNFSLSFFCSSISQDEKKECEGDYRHFQHKFFFLFMLLCWLCVISSRLCEQLCDKCPAVLWKHKNNLLIQFLKKEFKLIIFVLWETLFCIPIRNHRPLFSFIRGPPLSP